MGMNIQQNDWISQSVKTSAGKSRETKEYEVDLSGSIIRFEKNPKSSDDKNEDLSLEEKGFSMLRGVSKIAEDLFCENGKISLSKTCNTILTTVLFAVANKYAVAKGLMCGKTVSKILIGGGVGFGGYSMSNSIKALKDAQTKEEKSEAWQKIGEGSGIMLLSLGAAKPLTKGLKNIQTPTASPKTSLIEVLKASLETDAIVKTVTDKNSAPLFLYGLLANKVDF